MVLWWFRVELLSGVTYESEPSLTTITAVVPTWQLPPEPWLIALAVFIIFGFGVHLRHSHWGLRCPEANKPTPSESQPSTPSLQTSMRM